MMPGNARLENQSYLATEPKRIALAAKDTPLTSALGIPRLSSEAPIVSASSIVKSHGRCFSRSRSFARCTN
jgi:hypothetical protein